MHYAHVLLGRPQVAAVLEGDPGVARFKDHGQHFAPEVSRTNAAEVREFPAIGEGLVGLIASLEGAPREVVEVRRIAGGEEGPGAVFHDPLHEQVGDPVCRVHIVGAAAIVAGVLPQLEEFLDIQVPAFQVGADRPLALAALVHGHGGVVDHLQEGHHALALAIRPFDIGAHGPHRRPVVAEAARKLGQHGVVVDGPKDAVEIVRHRGEVAGGQLGPQGARIEERGRRRHVVEGREKLVKLDGARFPVLFLDGEAHGHAHKEALG